MNDKTRYAGLTPAEIEENNIPIVEPEFGIMADWNIKDPEKIHLEKITLNEKFSKLDRKEQVEEIESILDEKKELEKLNKDYLMGKTNSWTESCDSGT